MRADGPQLISELLRKTLRVECGVLMGANIAKDIGNEQLSEATIGYRTPDGDLFHKLFSTPYFYCTNTIDVVGVEMCGTLKNIVALASGMVQALGNGANTEVCECVGVGVWVWLGCERERVCVGGVGVGVCDCVRENVWVGVRECGCGCGCGCVGMHTITTSTSSSTTATTSTP